MMFKDEPKKNRDSRLYYPWRQKTKSKYSKIRLTVHRFMAFS